jgi:hypothetical protein
VQAQEKLAVVATHAVRRTDGWSAPIAGFVHLSPPVWLRGAVGLCDLIVKSGKPHR